MQWFIHSFYKHLWSPCCVQDTMPGVVDESQIGKMVPYSQGDLSRSGRKHKTNICNSLCNK